MIQVPVRIGRLGEDKKGYKVFVSRERPKNSRKINAWIPDLAPSGGLSKRYRVGRIAWLDFREDYLRELHAAESQDLIKPLALLSFRKTVVLLCGCSSRDCWELVLLAQAMEECRSGGNFILS